MFSVEKIDQQNSRLSTSRHFCLAHRRGVGNLREAVCVGRGQVDKVGLWRANEILV